MEVINKGKAFTGVKVIRRYRALARQNVHLFPATNYSEYEVGRRTVRIHNDLKPEMLRCIDAIILAFEWRTKELFGDEQEHYGIGRREA